ncbi:hypothetical protein DTL42_18300 [Bremerella cremea]|uniref:Phage tail protein n=1 Tax=Bremerella cremea TaxID=1031537 RepID=A0A368KMQ7_9BACT|nr:hypothetical protein [Bremerella cremea]RCS43938.1 hypothetical protein DTL42_18300 [Bremerella cremea]
MTAKYETLWQALKQQIVGLDLPGLTDETIRLQSFPANFSDHRLLSGAFLCPADEQEGDAGTNQSSDIGYGFSFTMLQKANSQLGQSQLSSLLAWREAVRRHFHHQSPLASSGCYRCTVESTEAIVPGAWAKQYDASTLIIRCWVLE